MATITVRVNDDEKAWLQYMAEFYGISLSALLVKYSIKDLEDEYDRQTAQVAHKKWLDDNQRTVSMGEIMREFSSGDD
ncbi:type II toxin-antitoxin system RelB family antitoxin [Lactiplantibacillus mudanjiangensis]|uniref:Antitoxin [Lactobacillus lindneri] n=1 Tax=Lactiplantibacillus mudanjiangensis TaxID=1296538 RepID=A0A660E189_9LACO|nr:DUF6290 family protein [Lactiplantibacillus mudanjiangensis]VDG19777.1 antitoxin [Lactobacillus lindneri] [Lactiplantibacillus mudanjiangensis]VDG23645.1 antitoxin [Lactobacillus lindneri] [Lactiplantibacillus mudanjiangensis]VDG27787.1 antitoxin [Lactobacillus lindneri] [Lactiplantibacillus mudanjiangensis]VDG31204.1 antitoxin [Lactobacillus lindneri] [Lactiplantibacillus mudanjiangensis]